MSLPDLSKIPNSQDTNQNFNTCNHDWIFLITEMKNSNLFTENCSKCFSNINTLELFKE